MKTQELSKEKLKRTYKVSVPSATVEEKRKAFILRKGKDYKMPGFRPGKVPFSQLEKVFSEEGKFKAVEEAVQEACDTFFKDQKFKTANRPSYELVAFPEKDSDLEFNLNFELFPEIDDITWDDLSLTFYEPELPKDAVEERLKELATSQRKGKALDKPRPAAPGDTLLVDIELRENPNAQPSRIENTTFLIEEGDPEKLEGIQKKAIGAQAGDVLEDSFIAPPNFPDKKVAGKTFWMKVIVHEVQETVPFEVEEALATHLGFENLEALKEHELAQVKQHGDMVANLSLKRQILDYLSQKHPLEIPESMVRSEFTNIWHATLKEVGLEPLPGQIEAFFGEAVKEDAANKNKLTKEAEATRKKLFQTHFEKTEDELLKIYKTVSERRVLLGLLFGKISEKHNIKLTSQELSQVLSAEVSRYPGQEKKVYAYYKNNPQAFFPIQMPFLEQKIVDFIAGEVPHEDKKIPLKQLEEMLEEGLF